MSVETQQSIAEWMDATLPGADPKSLCQALRALEAMAELCRAAGATNEVIAACASGEFRSDYTGLALPPDPGKVASRAADVVIVLYGVAHQRGFDLVEQVDRKMAVNRSRTRKANGDGTGYHVKAAQGDAAIADTAGPPAQR